MDQPILMIKSASPSTIVEEESPKETLLQIESLLEQEITQIRDRLESDSQFVVSHYLTQFNFHLQTDLEVVSVVLESEWKEQIEDNILLSEQASGNITEDLIDLDVSELMRIVKVKYSQGQRMFLERKSILNWIAQSSDYIPFISGLGSCDYLLLPAKSILSSMSQLNESLRALENTDND